MGTPIPTYIPSPTLNSTHPSQTWGSFIVFLSMYVARWTCWLYPLGCEGFLNFGPLACTHWGVVGGILGPSSYIKLRSAFLVVFLIRIQSGCKVVLCSFALGSNLRFVFYVFLNMLQSRWNDHISHYNIVHMYLFRDNCFLLVVGNVGIPIFHLWYGPKVGLIWFLQTILMVSQYQIDIPCSVYFMLGARI